MAHNTKIRCKFSLLGLKTLGDKRRYSKVAPERRGYIVGFGKDDCYWVIWDGTVTRLSYSTTFIDKIENDEY